MKHIASIILLLAASVPSAYAQTTTSCYGESKELKVGSLMPYIKVKVGTAEGYFLLDFGTTGSTIDTNNFINSKPKLAANTTNQFKDFDFYGSWGTVTLNIQNHSNIQGLQEMKQAGIIGTNFLSLNVFTLDYVNKKVIRTNAANFCSDTELKNQGFKAASTAGYYSNQISKLNNTCTANVPTVPVKIGKIAAIAQIDPGYDDVKYRHSVNINQAFFNSLTDAGIALVENNTANFTLSTCVAGLQENVKAYKLPNGVNFTITGTDGDPISISADANIFLKQTPEQAKQCGGIGTWQVPAAQLGASFLIDAKKVIFDPFKSKVWFYTL